MTDVNIGELVTVSLPQPLWQAVGQHHQSQRASQKMQMRGNVKVADGGRDIVQEIEYAENGTVVMGFRVGANRHHAAAVRGRVDLGLEEPCRLDFHVWPRRGEELRQGANH